MNEQDQLNIMTRFTGQPTKTDHPAQPVLTNRQVALLAASNVRNHEVGMLETTEGFLRWLNAAPGTQDSGRTFGDE